MLSSKLDPRRIEADAAKGQPSWKTSMLRYCDSINSANRGEHCAQPLCRGRGCGWTRFHRELDDTRSFVPCSPTQADRHRATRWARDRYAHNGDLYGVVDIFRPTYLNAPLKATRGPPLRVDQIFEKVRPPTHGAKFSRSPWFF